MSAMPDPDLYQRIEEREKFKGERVQVFEDRVRFPDGHEGTHTRVRHSESELGVVVIPRDSAGRILMLRVHRYLFPDASWEFVRGNLDAGEEPEVAARREALEETGLRLQDVEEIGWLRPDTGIWTTEVAVMLAPVDPTGQRITVEREEGIVAARFMEPAAVWAMVGAGELRDGITLAALALFSARENRDGATAPQ
jgi:8-oxo-dGTP pyrophosphatase MutT (NUDIX family)